MAINDDDSRILLFDYYGKKIGEKEEEWISKGSDSEESFDVEVNLESASYDMNSNLFRNGSEPREAPEKIPYPTPHNTLPKYPKEKLKTVVAFFFLVFGFLLNSISIALTHDRVPDRPPLPDAVLDNIHIIPELMKLPDVLVMITMVLSFITVILHHHRWIVTRRVFFILSILYSMRSITMYVTVLPVANYTVYCSPKSNSTSVYLLVKRVSELIVGGGMQISGQKNTCGDYIYSGHTVILMTGYSILKEYYPKKFVILHWISCIMSWCGMGILLIARGHYTIDVLIGYYAATRMFWTYHSLCNNANFKKKSENNYYSNVWWFPVFQYLEGNVGARLPRQYSLPWTSSSQRQRFRNPIFR